MESDRTIYFALTGDIASSRELADRAAVQQEIRSMLETSSSELDTALAAPLQLIRGDEIQGLFRHPDRIVDVVVRLADALHPVAVMWGLGRGPLSTELLTNVSAVDGPCLHRARDALEEARREESWVVAGGFGDPHDGILSTLFRLIWTVRSTWTPTQMKYVHDVRTRTQTNVAALHDVTRQAVSKSLDAARLTAVLDGEEAARSYLRWLEAHSPDAAGNTP